MGDPCRQSLETGGVGLLLRINALSSWRRLKAVGRQSRLLSFVVFAFISSYLVLAHQLFFHGFRFLSKFPGFGTALAERLLYLLFAFLFALLLLSNLVVSYSNLFRNRETSFLLSLPLSRNTVFTWKFIESTALASWAFLFLITPLLAAFGQVRNVSWDFFPVTMALVGLFIVLPATAGAYLAVNVARYLDRRVFQMVVCAVVVGLLAMVAWWYETEPPPAELAENRLQVMLDTLLVRTLFSEHPLLPSQWLSTTVLQWTDGAWHGAARFILLLLSYALFFGMLACTRFGNIFYEAASEVQSRGHVLGKWGWFKARRSRKHPGVYDPGLAERFADWLWWLQPAERALVVKDFRVFWRDTTQWAQSLVLFGLLGVYIFNLRHFSQQLTNPFWVHLVSYLNLGACSLNLATLTTRFVYPQFSLEGKRLWIVGLAPMGLVRIVRIKYWLAVSISLLITFGLIASSCHMLKLNWPRTLFFTGAVTLMTLSLNGLAVGLGVIFPNFKEENPTKIVSGFGGTFCLVLSFLYILGSVLLLAFLAPWTSRHIPINSQSLLMGGSFLLLSILVGWVPYRAGLKRVGVFEL